MKKHSSAPGPRRSRVKTLGGSIGQSFSTKAPLHHQLRVPSLFSLDPDNIPSPPTQFSPLSPPPPVTPPPPFSTPQTSPKQAASKPPPPLPSNPLIVCGTCGTCLHRQPRSLPGPCHPSLPAFSRRPSTPPNAVNTPPPSHSLEIQATDVTVHHTVVFCRPYVLPAVLHTRILPAYFPYTPGTA